ncbi:protein kinase domain-containing protein [Candidatus Protochlamydia phocaeensis]|uniref:protein kinase domain-containing protein n=1 Tax=Candidatus Protochlamydia phocaeensis TaxID=1414722 RepID=UPI0008386B60|nr:protein kinase [Candidatus Protochlamydia phocaeensis]
MKTKQSGEFSFNSDSLYYQSVNSPQNIILKSVDGTIQKIQSLQIDPQQTLYSKTLGLLSLSCFIPERTHVMVRIKASDHPLYIKISDLSQAIGISEKAIRQASEQARGDVSDLVQAEQELAETMNLETLNRVKGFVNQIGNFNYLKPLAKVLSETQDFDYTQSLATVISRLKLKNLKVLVKQVKDKQISGNEKMQETIKAIGKQLAQQQDLSNSQAFRFESANDQHYPFTLYDGGIYISREPLAKGGNKDINEAIQLNNLEEYVEARSKPSSIASAGANVRNLRKLHSLGIPHIVPNYKFSHISEDSYEPSHYAVQQRMDGDGEKLKKVATPKQYCQVMRDVAIGLKEIHKQHFIHGDIKPANILFKQQTDGQMKGYIHDFDTLFNTLIDDKKEFIGGTLTFLPPEHLDENGDLKINEQMINDKFDSFSLGITILAFVDPKFNAPVNNFASKKLKQDQMDGYLDSVSSKISKSSLSEDEKTLTLGMLEITKGLLKIDPDNRLSCADAAVGLDKLIT